MNPKVAEVINQIREWSDGLRLLENISGSQISSDVEHFIKKLTDAIKKAEEESAFIAINNYEEGKLKGYEMACFERESQSLKSVIVECGGKSSTSSGSEKVVRNCDIGTPEEQAKRHENWCNTTLRDAHEFYDNEKQCLGCYSKSGDTRYCFSCPFQWMQMPYEGLNTVPLGHPATEAQIDRGVAEWCWECGNPKCPASKKDVLVMCDQFVQRSEEDLKSDPHYGGTDGE